MIGLKKGICNPLKSAKGFTLIEVMIVTLIIGVLAAIAIPNFKFLNKKAFDTIARSDARNLVDSVINAVLDEQDVNYAKAHTGGDVGNIDTGGLPRNAVFVLSPGVEALIIGDTAMGPNGNTTYFEAYVYHTSGTVDISTLSGRKEYQCVVDEASAITILP
ncbi:MAG: type II secretion system protein [Pseudomonadota bacterium]